MAPIKTHTSEFMNLKREGYLNALSTLDMEAKRARYKTVPAHAIPKTKFTDATANGLTKAIVEWLTLNGCWATRVTSAGRYLPLMGKYIPSTTKRGTADIHAVIAGRHCSIEVKIGRDKMSDAQKKVKAQVETAGGLYFIARSFDEFMKWYKSVQDLK